MDSNKTNSKSDSIEDLIQRFICLTPRSRELCLNALVNVHSPASEKHSASNNFKSRLNKVEGNVKSKYSHEEKMKALELYAKYENRLQVCNIMLKED